MTCLLAWDLRSLSRSWVKRFTWALWVRVSRRLEPIPRICIPDACVIYTAKTLAEPDSLFDGLRSLSCYCPQGTNPSYIRNLRFETQVDRWSVGVRMNNCSHAWDPFSSLAQSFLNSHMLSAWATDFVSKRQLKFCRPCLQVGSCYHTVG